VAGVVDRVGAGVDDSWLGRRVVAHLGPVPGGYAEQAVTAVGSLFQVPESVSLPQAVAAVGTGRTAQGILELEPPATDDVVLVPSAAGGLGWLLVQAAQAAGATVVAAAGGPERVAALDRLGVEMVVSYAEPGWDEAVRSRTDGVTVVYDGVGGDVGRQALELLRPGGRLVMFGFSAGEPTKLDTDDVVSRGITVGWSLGPRMQGLPGGIPGLAARALERVAAGTWHPLVTTYPLAEAGHAHADLEARRALGKVVLVTERAAP
jgi:NADPH2:quinone reductase